MGKHTTIRTREQVAEAIAPLIPFLESRGVKFTAPTRIAFRHENKNVYYNPFSGKNASSFYQFLSGLITNDGGALIMLFRGNPTLNYRIIETLRALK